MLVEVNKHCKKGHSTQELLLHYNDPFVIIVVKILVTWCFMTHSRVSTILYIWEPPIKPDDSHPVTQSQLPTLLVDSFKKFYRKYFINTNLSLRTISGLLEGGRRTPWLNNTSPLVLKRASIKINFCGSKIPNGFFCVYFVIKEENPRMSIYI